jgi:WXG100 family type VII secretion target
MSQYTYTNSGMTSAIQGLSDETQAIASAISTLEANCQDLVQNWIGPAKNGWYTSKQQWDQAVSSMQSLLGQSSSTLSDMHTGYTNTENNNADGWSGFRI